MNWRNRKPVAGIVVGGFVTAIGVGLLIFGVWGTGPGRSRYDEIPAFIPMLALIASLLPLIAGSCCCFQRWNTEVDGNGRSGNAESAATTSLATRPASVRSAGRQ